MIGIRAFLARLFYHVRRRAPVMDQERYLFLDGNPDPVGKEGLVKAARGLVEYRHAAGPLGFQLEKADWFIELMRIALKEMGEETAPGRYYGNGGTMNARAVKILMNLLIHIMHMLLGLQDFSQADRMKLAELTAQLQAAVGSKK